MARSVLPLAALAFATTLVITRFGLVAHELIGHGGPALAFGADITELKLFWFAGGRIGYARDGGWSLGAAITVQLGGIALELALAAVLVAVARRLDRVQAPVQAPAPLGPVLVRGAAAGFAGHALIYLATGVFDGKGDGTMLYRALGAWRPLLWAPAAVGCVAVAYLGARAAFDGLRTRAPGRQITRVAAALVLAGVAMGGLVRGELAVRTDATYAALMRTEGQRAVEREVAAAAAEGRDQAAARRDAEARHRAFPFALALFATMGVAAVIGVARSRPAVAPVALAWRELRPVAAWAVAGLGLVILVDLLSRS